MRKILLLFIFLVLIGSSAGLEPKIGLKWIGGMPFVTVGPSSGNNYVVAGNADDELNAALDAMAALGGGVVELEPHSTYIMSANVTVHQFCVLRSGGESYASVTPAEDYGSSMIVRSSSGTAVSMIAESHTRITGLKFYDSDQATNATPTAYAAAIMINANPVADVEIDHCCFTNSYIAISSNYGNDGSTFRIHDNTGYPLYRGIELGRSADTQRIQNNHFICNYCPSAGSVLRAWVKANGVAIWGSFLENSMIQDNFAFEYFRLIYLTSTNYGCHITGNHADNCVHPIYINSGYNIIVNANSFTGSTAGRSDFTVTESTISNNYFHGIGVYFTNCAKTSIVGNRLHDMVNHGMFFFAGTNLTITGNTITGDSSTTWQGIGFDTDCRRFTCTGNVVDGIPSPQHTIDCVAGSDYYVVTNNICNLAPYFGDTAGSTRVQSPNVYG